MAFVDDGFLEVLAETPDEKTTPGRAVIARQC
jgi:hypothetical protein